MTNYVGMQFALQIGFWKAKKWFRLQENYKIINFQITQLIFDVFLMFTFNLFLLYYMSFFLNTFKKIWSNSKTIHSSYIYIPHYGFNQFILMIRLNSCSSLHALDDSSMFSRTSYVVQPICVTIKPLNHLHYTSIWSAPNIIAFTSNTV